MINPHLSFSFLPIIVIPFFLSLLFIFCFEDRVGVVLPIFVLSETKPLGASPTLLLCFSFFRFVFINSIKMSPSKRVPQIQEPPFPLPQVFFFTPSQLFLLLLFRVFLPLEVLHDSEGRRLLADFPKTISPIPFPSTSL